MGRKQRFGFGLFSFFFFFNSWDAHRAMNLCILGFFSVAFTGDH